MSVLIAGSVAAGLAAYLRDKNAELAAASRREDVLVLPTAARALGPGTVLTAEDLGSLRIATSYVPDSVAHDMEKLLGRTVKERLLPGEVIRPERLAPEGLQSGLSALVDKGGRAVSLEVSDADRVSGFIEPGDAVDVLVTFPKERDVPAATVTLGQNLRVLAVDEVMSETAEGEPVKKEQITLAINPVDAERIVHASTQGEPRLTLRADADHEIFPLASGPIARLGAESYSVKQWREMVTATEYAAMVARLEQERKPEPVAVDPHLLRPIVHKP